MSTKTYKSELLLVGLLLSAMVLVAIIRHHRQELPLAPSSVFGRSEFLFLIILLTSLTVSLDNESLPGSHLRFVKTLQP